MGWKSNKDKERSMIEEMDRLKREERAKKSE